MFKSRPGSVTVDASTVMRKPPSMSWSAAASVSEAWLTAFKLVHLVGQVQTGDTVLLHAAASGVGLAAIQLVVAAGGTAFVTVGTKAKLAQCLSAGAAGGAVRHDGPWLETITTLLPVGSKGVNVVLDPVASGHAKQNLEVMSVDGRWVLYSLLSGPSLPEDVAKSFLGALARSRGSHHVHAPSHFYLHAASHGQCTNRSVHAARCRRQKSASRSWPPLCAHGQRPSSSTS